MARQVYSRKDSTTPAYKAMGGAVLMLFIILGLLPLSQALTTDPEDREEITQATVTEPPPPPPPPPPEEEEPPPPEETPPEMQEPPPPISLSQLEAALNPGTGGVGLAQDLSFEQQPDTLGEMIFDVQDLDRVPKVIRRGRLDYPPEMRRDRIEGIVVLQVIIDERGRVNVDKVLRASHREFVREAVQAAENSVFEAPVRGGEKVKARYKLPIQFNI